MAEPYSFGRFSLDPAGNSLYADGAPVPLGATDLRLLLALVESGGAVVPKDELMSRVWGSRAIGENALYVHINILRKALGDDIIVNKPGLGYRFVIPVGRTEHPPKQPEPRDRRGNLPLLFSGTAKDAPFRLIGRGEQL